MKKEYDFSKGSRGAVLTAPPGKTRVTIRLDDDILDWFRQQVDDAGGVDDGVAAEALDAFENSRSREAALPQHLDDRRIKRLSLPAVPLTDKDPEQPAGPLGFHGIGFGDVRRTFLSFPPASVAIPGGPCYNLYSNGLRVRFLCVGPRVAGREDGEKREPSDDRAGVSRMQTPQL